MSAHGGTQFETMDISETRSVVVDDGNEVEKVSHQLYTDCKNSVEENIKQFDNEMQLMSESPAPKEKRSKKEESDIGIDRAELGDIAEILQKLVNVDTVEGMQELGDEIAAMKDLKKSQLDYLRKKYNMKAKELANVK